MDLITQIKHMVVNNVKERQTTFYSTDEIMAKLYVWAVAEHNKQKREEAKNDDTCGL